MWAAPPAAADLADTFLLNNVALFSHDLSSDLLVGTLELLPLSTHLLLLLLLNI
jgi:hypothetical protein